MAVGQKAHQGKHVGVKEWFATDSRSIEKAARQAGRRQCEAGLLDWLEERDGTEVKGGE